MLILLLLGLLLAFLLQRIIYEKNWKKRLDMWYEYIDILMKKARGKYIRFSGLKK